MSNKGITYKGGKFDGWAGSGQPCTKCRHGVVPLGSDEPCAMCKLRQERDDLNAEVERLKHNGQ